VQKKSIVMTALVAALLCVWLLAGPVRSDEKWKEDHPRRAQVNNRLHNQNDRIKDGVKNGKLTGAEAKQLHQADRGVRKEERADAAAHGGHITKAEKRQLNKEENAISKKIYDEKHPAK
jgi:hypothetical protein